MIASVATRLTGPRSRLPSSVVLSSAVLAGSLLAYGALRNALILVSERSPVVSLAFDVFALFAAWTFSGVRHSDIPALLRPLMRGIGAVMLVQVAFDDLSLLYGPRFVITGTNGVFFGIGGAIGLAAGVLALWRPSYLLPLFFHYVAFRHQLNRATGIEVSETDYLSMLDIGEFVLIGGFITVWSVPSLARWNMATAQPAHHDARLRDAAAGLVWAWAVGAHFGNYFISGWTKIRTGGADPFFWLLHNPTQTSILIGLERGDNPLAAWPALVQLSWGAISTGVIGLNLFVLGTQITAPLAILRRRALMLYTLLFDVFHVAVYLTLGAAFFFWVAVNAFIFASARRLSDEDLSRAMKCVGVLAVFVAHFGFYTSHLGWLDGAKLASPSFWAETRTGEVVPVPSVYFGLLSYSIAQTAMFIPDDHFPMRLGGNTYNRREWLDAQTCGPEIRRHQDTGVDLAKVERFVRQTDAAMRRAPIVKAWDLFYLYPHHMVANPLMFDRFNRLSIDDIVGYRYIVDSVCLSLHDGRLVRNVRKRSEYEIPVGR